ncbi:hypothetical protein FQA47_000424 [Oryzias melastigma]|uniref:Uncharacterized protein n=1 Tax=Oryzias melastigma TaxID=30732 RepID=A0A834CK92_ORYME|nr:hypothetical protein FQA47_000424 [Oryzias melastigma]
MSDKSEPIPDTRVRKLRKDGSWIRRQDDSPTSKPEDLETKPLVKRNSYVLMAIKRYESLDSSSVSPPPETDTNPSDRDSTNQNGEKAKFLHDGVQPDGSSGQTPSNTKLANKII